MLKPPQCFHMFSKFLFLHNKTLPVWTLTFPSLYSKVGHDFQMSRCDEGLVPGFGPSVRKPAKRSSFVCLQCKSQSLQTSSFDLTQNIFAVSFVFTEDDSSGNIYQWHFVDLDYLKLICQESCRWIWSLMSRRFTDEFLHLCSIGSHFLVKRLPTPRRRSRKTIDRLRLCFPPPEIERWPLCETDEENALGCRKGKVRTTQHAAANISGVEPQRPELPPTGPDLAACWPQLS